MKHSLMAYCRGNGVSGRDGLREQSLIIPFSHYLSAQRLNCHQHPQTILIVQGRGAYHSLK